MIFQIFINGNRKKGLHQFCADFIAVFLVNLALTEVIQKIQWFFMTIMKTRNQSRNHAFRRQFLLFFDVFVLLLEYFRRKWNYSLSMSVKS